MLIINLSCIDSNGLQEKYVEKLSIIDESSLLDVGMIGYIELIKTALTKFEAVIVTYKEDVLMCLDALNIDYTLVIPNANDTRLVGYEEDYLKMVEFTEEEDTILLDVNETLESALGSIFDWVDCVECVPAEEVVEDIVVVPEEKPVQQVPINKNKLTLQELIEQDIDITEADVRELKSTTNKFKVAMLLQAKSRLNTVLKLCGVLDKLYDELVTRIDESIKTTDTASLMYTTDYIAKALSETNQFIMSLITNEKIQNFFIIDNSNVINISDDRVDINKRERIRKAAEIVIDNIDYFTSGDFNKITNPNQPIEVVAEETETNT